MAGVGLLLLTLGGAVAFIAAAFNMNTPVQTGPLPVVGGAALAVVGLVLFIHFQWEWWTLLGLLGFPLAALLWAILLRGA